MASVSIVDVGAAEAVMFFGRGRGGRDGDAAESYIGLRPG
jgi:hypothetical protein